MIDRDDRAFIDDAIMAVQNMLSSKKDIWTATTPALHQFDAMRDLHISPTQFGLIMCQLKMNRAKQCFDKHIFNSSGYSFEMDTSAQDSILDLACYAILTLALMKRTEFNITEEQLVEKILNDIFDDTPSDSENKDAQD